jgi:hypothetical protein
MAKTNLFFTEIVELDSYYSGDVPDASEVLVTCCMHEFRFLHILFRLGKVDPSWEDIVSCTK